VHGRACLIIERVDKYQMTLSIASRSQGQRRMADRFHLLTNSQLLGVLQNTKTAKVLLYIIVPTIISSVILGVYSGYKLATTQTEFNEGFYMTDSYWFITPDSTTTFAGYVISFSFQALAIYLAIVWSRLHNRRVDASTGQTPS
jgi:hypothetical protein